MKILVLSDIHGRKLVMEKILEIIGKEKPDEFFFLGDYLYNGPRNGVPSDYDGLAVADMLRPLLKKAIFVKGNCDADVDEMVLETKLARRACVFRNGRRSVLVHGDDVDPMFLDLQEGDILFSGHTHIQVLKEEKGITYLNPGSPSFPKGGNEASYAVFTEKGIAIHRLIDSSVIASMDF